MAFKREQVVRSAEKYVAKGKIEAAIKEYRKVLAENPNDASTLNRVGDLYARINDTDEAIKFFTQIAEQYAEDGFLVKGIAIYKKIIKLDPGRLSVYEKLAELYHRQGLITEARSQYQVLGDYYLKHHDAAAAINIYQKMTELEPENPSHFLKLAELFQQGKLWDKAMKAYRRIAELMLEHGRVEEAVRVYQRAIEVHSEDVGFITDAVLALRDAGHNGSAARLLSRAVELNPAAEKVAHLVSAATDEVVAEAEEEEEMPFAASPEAMGLPEADVGATAEMPGSAMEELGEADSEIELEMEEDAFVLDLEDDSSSSMVLPPEDMDSPGSAFSGVSSPEAAEPAIEEPSGGDLEEAEFELEFDDSGAAMEVEGIDEEAAEPVVEVELEPPQPIDWALEPEVEVELEESAADEIATAEEGEAVSGAEPAEAEVEAAPRAQDLLAEAEVFAKYGLEEKALERLKQIFEQEPENLDALQLQVEIHLKAKDAARAASAGARLRAAALSKGDGPRWMKVGAKLERAGVSLPGEDWVPPAPEEGRVSKLLKSLEDEAPPSAEMPEAIPVGPRPEPEGEEPLHELEAEEAATEPAVEELPSEAFSLDLASEAEVEVEEVPPEAVPVEPPPTSPPTERTGKGTGSLKIDAALAELTAGFKPSRAKRPGPPTVAEEPPAESPAPFAASVEGGEEMVSSPAAEAGWEEGLPPVAAAAGEGAFEDELPDIRLPEESLPSEELEDSSMDWLEDIPAEPTATTSDRLFDDEEDFFDLAAELEEELVQEESRLEDDIVGKHDEPSLEEIVEGFKKGVAENLSQEDYDTHYNLGIAYREMGLLDEAIGEFQLASKSPVHLVDCCSMLGISFLEKGLPELAIKWYQKGLSAPDLGGEVMLSLLYETGEAYLSLGDEEAARKTFVELYGINSHYRDVTSKLNDLGVAS